MQEEQQPLLKEGVGDSWRCTGCDTLIYNLRYIDGRLVPVEGAPSSRWFSNEYPRLCSVCFQLALIIQADYWKKLEEEDKATNKRKNKLRRNGRYLD